MVEEAFAVFLREKRVDPQKWEAEVPNTERRIHITSFQVLGRQAYEQRYLFYFNRWRKLYPLSEPSSA
ncbi:MAG: hypothetical protein KatS3mg025_0612 [Bacteroidia bacterium]|jgi:hypothetical protein|nr:MAG: hypothetical protein KatS3mg025_0612 [Bacteroidia bacterium]